MRQKLHQEVNHQVAANKSQAYNSKIAILAQERSDGGGSGLQGECILCQTESILSSSALDLKA